MPNDALLTRLRERLPDQFSQDALNDALHVLGQADNKMRAHQFAGTLREFIAHILAVLAPTGEVTRCAWFKQDKNVEGPTRRQRALYAPSWPLGFHVKTDIGVLAVGRNRHLLGGKAYRSNQTA
jgi:hypothetical protein